MSIYETQTARLDEILPWARTVGELRGGGVWQPNDQMVHLRPSGTGIRLVDLNPIRPQLDRGKICRHEEAHTMLPQLLQQTLVNTPGRPTPEKRLQSWLLAQAYRHEKQIMSLAPDLIFVTDEQRFPVAQNDDFVCDLLALRATAPVVIELKSAREMKRSIEQLDVAAAFVDMHRERFAGLFGAILGRTVALDRKCEKWLVWPASQGYPTDPRAHELASQKIRVVSYNELGNDFSFKVAPPVAL